MYTNWFSLTQRCQWHRPVLTQQCLCQTGRVWASWPAEKSGRSVKEKKNSNADVCIYVCQYVSCSAAVLFTCTIMRSRLDSNEGVECETWSVGTNSKMLGGPGQTRNTLEKEGQHQAQSKPESWPWRTYSRGAPRRWLFKYVQIIITCASSYDVNYHKPYNMYHNISCPGVDLQYCFLFCFRRLKINHAYREFILEFGTVVNSVNDTSEAWLSGVISDLKLEYLGKLNSFIKTILGYESEA
jgi:hypothetical protein